MLEAVPVRYVNGKYVRESEYVPPKRPRLRLDSTWTTTEELPSGRLRLVVYSTYNDIDWSLSFQESPTKSIVETIPAIVKAMEDSAPVLLQKIEEAAQRAEAFHQKQLVEAERWKREDDQRRTAQSIKESGEKLGQMIEAWSRARGFEDFFREVAARAADLPEAERQDILKRLQVARELAGQSDPLQLFEEWRTPRERYNPLADGNDASA